LFFALLLYVLLFPIFKNKLHEVSIKMHPEASRISEIQIPVYHKIGIALDFSDNDFKLISAAIGQGKEECSFTLIHIVESASSKLHGNQSADYETEKDKERMDDLINQMTEKGYLAKGVLGFNETSKEIIRIVKEEQVDLLIIGAHGHTGIKDFIYGTTINAVRHELRIPVFIVNV
jgi:manganese transport protein